MIRKNLYRIKKEYRTWYVRIDVYLMILEFTKNDMDSNIYYKVVDDDNLILVMYY